VTDPVLSARGKIARAAARKDSKAEYEARQEISAARVERAILRALGDAPPLTAAARSRLAGLLTGEVIAACKTEPVVVQACDLNDEMRRWAFEQVADHALNNNVTVTIIGQKADGDILLCDTGCCFFRPGVLVVCPDVDVLQLGGVPEGSMRMERQDGRTAVVFQGLAR
jgi:hypothetical protein